MIRVVLVDDEPLAREALRILLARESDVAVVGEADGAAAAVRTIRGERPDLVLLDVQMPDGDGFGVLEDVAPDHLPEVIFVTAHDRYALRAFERFALDYLLKPVDPGRFTKSMARARRLLGANGGLDGRHRLGALLDALEGKRLESDDLPLTHFPVKVQNHFRIVHAHEVRWIGAAGNYVLLHARDGEHLIRMTLSELERRLDPRTFARIHRRTIVSLASVREIAALGHGAHDVVLDDGTRLRLGREYRDRLAR